MRTGGKVALIAIGATLLIGGGVIFAIGLKDHKIVAETREVDLKDYDFNNFNFDIDTADVRFIVTRDSTKKIVFQENKHENFECKEEEHTLYVTSKFSKKWYEWIVPDWTRKKVDVYLPASDLGALKVKSSTGNLKVPHDFTFESADIHQSTGDVEYLANTSGEVKIEVSTGDVKMQNVNVKTLTLKHSTGKATLNTVRAETIDIKGSTGNVKLTDVITTCELKVHGSTSNIIFDSIDGNGIDFETSTGDVKGTVLTGKMFDVKSDTGKETYPTSTSGAPKFRVRTSTGDIKISVKA